jgi:hypothetical protein
VAGIEKKITLGETNSEDLFLIMETMKKVHSVVFFAITSVYFLNAQVNTVSANAFHAGMDEVFYIGDKNCQRCSGKDKSELFAGEVRTIRDHLADKVRKLWIWGDRHYERPDQTAVYFAMKGLSVVTCPWKNPGNAVLQAQDMLKFRKTATKQIKERYMGMVQTIWSGAGQFLDNFYGRKPEKGDNTQVGCFRALFAEIQK